MRESLGAPRWIGLGAIVLTLGLMGVRTQSMFVALASAALVVIIFSFAQLAKGERPIRWCAAIAYCAVLVQGVLGGLRVTLLKDEIGILHGTLAQLFFVLVSLIALLTSTLWQRVKLLPAVEVSSRLRLILMAAMALIFAQLILGATMRHQHAGLAVPDFPLAYGKVWPPMDETSLEVINQRRLDVRDFKPITALQIGLHMAHRIGALVALASVGAFTWQVRKQLGSRTGLARLSLTWLAILLLQASLGAATVLSNKAADVATAHVVGGALSLLCGTVLCLATYRLTVRREDLVKSGCPTHGENSISRATLASRPI
jgi:cytochrome c oxidase assembly protein subunit 15